MREYSKLFLPDLGTLYLLGRQEGKMEVKRRREEKDKTYKWKRQPTSPGGKPQRQMGVVGVPLSSKLHTVSVWKEKALFMRFYFYPRS